MTKQLIDDQWRRLRLVIWLLVVSALGALNYAAQLSGTETPDDLAYRYSSSVAALVQYGIMFGILVLIASGLPRREMFALRRPASWRRAIGLAGLALLAIYAAAFVYERVLSIFGDWSPTDEQGLVPKEWDPSRAGATKVTTRKKATNAPARLGSHSFGTRPCSSVGLQSPKIERTRS